MRWIKALAAVVAIAAIAVIPPALLVTFIGSPVPAAIGLDTQLSDDALIRLLSGIVWLLWAQTMWCIAAEVVGAARSTNLGNVPGTFGVQQHFARVLVGAIIASAVAVPALAATDANATPVPAPAAPTAPTATATDDQADQQQSTTTPDENAADQSTEPKPDHTIVTVQRGETLWEIAEKHLGNGERWNDIAAANEGRNMTDGRTFHASDVIRPGWELIIPGTRADQSTASTNPAETDYTVKKGDTFTQIARDHVGDANAWPALYEASKKLDQPVPLTDPDRIYPGQKIDLPNDGAPTPRGAAENQSPPWQAPPDAVQDQSDRQQNNADAGWETGQSTANTSTSPRAIEGDAEHQAAPEAAADARPDRADSDLEETAQDEDDQQLPGWIMRGLLGAGTLLAGALLLTLRRRQASQHRTRRPGRTITVPGPQLATVEKSVTAAGATTTGTVELVDELLKRLAGSIAAAGDPMPVLAAVEVTTAAVAVHLKEAADPPSGTPWVASDDELLWVVDKDVDLDAVGVAPTDSTAPWPLLVTIGHDDRGSSWLLNIEDLGVTVTGDRVAAGDFARFIAAEVACNPWSKHTALDVVGVAGEVAVISPDRIHVHATPAPAAAEAVAEAVHTIDRLAEYGTDTATARARGSDPDVWPSRLVIVEHLEGCDELDQLVDLVSRHRGRTATGVVLSGPVNAEGFEIRIDERRQLRIPAVNLSVTAVGLTVEEAHGCAALLAQADQQSDSPAPDLAGGEEWQTLATATGSLRDQYRVSRGAATLDRSSSLLDGTDDAYTSVAPTTSDDLAALAPKVTQTVRDQVAEADPDLDADLEAWFSDECARPRLRLLGPVEARASGAALAKRTAFYTELFAYLATRPYGATTDEVATDVKIPLERVKVDINMLRDWFGVNPATGEKFIPDARHSPAAQQRGIGVYQVIGALVDIDLFRRLRVRGESRGADGIHDLVRALQLVAGRPFEKLRQDGWKWVLEGDRLDRQMVCAVTDVAHIVVTHSLHAEDLGRARTAAGIALLAAPYEEVARLDLAAVLEAQGHGAEAERIVRDDVCNRSDDGEAPTDLPERTEQIIDARRWLHRAAI